MKYVYSGKGGPSRKWGTVLVGWDIGRLSRGQGTPPPHRHKLPKQVKKNSVKPLPNVTEHRS